jgi:hypothetical protein
VDRDRLDEFLDEDPSLLRVGVLPDGIELERGIAQNGGSPLEGLDERVRLALPRDCLAVVGFEGSDLRCQLALLVRAVAHVRAASAGSDPRDA